MVVSIVDRGEWTAEGSAFVLRTAGLLLPYALMALLFSTARCHNRRASVYDLLSGARVIDRVARVLLHPIDADTPGPARAASGRIGPFDVYGEIAAAEPGRLVLGHDPVLKRDVWLYQLPPGTPAVSDARRRLARPCRLRWLAGVRTVANAWDAYEAPDGAALRRVAERGQRWGAVRGWLPQLAAEIESGITDGTLQRMSLDHVWITRRGAARLLDFPVGEPHAQGFAPSIAGTQRFLYDVAATALMGRRSPTSIEKPLPAAARIVLTRLEAAEFGALAEVRGTLEQLLAQSDRVTRRRRAASILLPGLPLLFTVVTTGVALRMMGDVGRHAEFPDLPSIVMMHLAVIGMFATATAAATRSGTVLWLWGITATTGTGERPSRGRAAWRSLIAWSPILGAAAVVLSTDLGSRADLAITTAGIAIWVAGALYGIVNSERGVPDYLAGTWLVPR